MAKIMAIGNLTPDSFFAPSRVEASGALARVGELLAQGADIIDFGAVSTRPGAQDVPVEQEWERLEPVLRRCDGSFEFSIDTTSAEIVRRAYALAGPFIVNDISAGEDDPEMLPTVSRLGLKYIAMHKRGNPRTMDSRCEYPEGVVPALVDYFRRFERIAAEKGIGEWILDPGLGFAKTPQQCWEILEQLEAFAPLGRPVLIGAADKRFTAGDTEKAHRTALLHGADILRVHDVPAAIQTLKDLA